ncbi:MAG TPA: hypothetical protein PLA45_00470 [Candidatus Dojkabacteria bacterium]|nr:hypothetical protein [Candidatus Dojkabacteria bacterium]
MFLAHGPISYLANEIIQKKKISHLKFHEQLLVSILAIFFGILPDIDLLILPMFSIPQFSHHNYFTHAPLFYLGLWLLLKLNVYIFDRIVNKKTSAVLHHDLMDVILNTFLIATMTHFLADTLVGGIMLLYPISTFKFTILSSFMIPNLFQQYFLLPDFAIELVLCSLFFIHIYKKFFLKNIFFDVLKYFFVSASAVFLFVTVFFSTQTYNKSYMYDNNGKANYDVDMDGLNDKKDMDIDNDGIDNIVDIDLKKLTKEVKDISESGKLASFDTGSIQYMFGGFNSYRLLSQAYFNISSPIEGVLRNTEKEREYWTKLEYPELLYGYFNANALLKELDLTQESVLNIGTLMFLLDESDKVVNIALVVDEDSVGVVLPQDRQLKTHTLQELFESKYTSVKVTK